MQPTDSQKRTKMFVRLHLDPDLHRLLRIRAAEHDKPMSIYVRDLLQSELRDERHPIGGERNKECVT